MLDFAPRNGHGMSPDDVRDTLERAGFAQVRLDVLGRTLVPGHRGEAGKLTPSGALSRGIMRARARRRGTRVIPTFVDSGANTVHPSAAPAPSPPLGLGVIALPSRHTASAHRNRHRPPLPRRPRPRALVLKTERTIDFTTDEVTWMSVDVSPDGRTLVFDLLGDLYTLPIAGGAATRIVGGLSFESQPTWSPDGKTIAFLSDRTGVENLWIANADGSNPAAR